MRTSRLVPRFRWEKQRVTEQHNRIETVCPFCAQEVRIFVTPGAGTPYVYHVDRCAHYAGVWREEQPAIVYFERTEYAND